MEAAEGAAVRGDYMDGILSPNTNFDWSAMIAGNKFLSPDVNTNLTGNKFLSPDINTNLSGELVFGDKNTSNISKKSVYYAPINIIGSPNASASPTFSDTASSGQSGGQKSLLGIDAGAAMPLLLIGGAALLFLMLSGKK